MPSRAPLSAIHHCHGYPQPACPHTRSYTARHAGILLALPSSSKLLPRPGHARSHLTCASGSSSSSSDEALNKFASRLENALTQAQAKAVRATQPYPLATSILVIFCAANFLTQHSLIPALASLNFEAILGTLVPAAFSSHVPREFASISLSEVTVKTFMPGAWLALIASFTHISVFHLWVTTAMIKDLGENLEPQVGTLRTIGVYIIAAAFTCWANVSLTGSALLGASGAASGLLGALLLEILFKPGQAVSKLWSTGLWLLVLGFTLKLADPRVYLWGLGSGAAASLLFGLLPMFVRPMLTVLTAVSGFAMLGIMAIACLRIVKLV